ncbi:MAG: TldD/PmbA family protein [Bacteroidales bacterium]
MDYLELAGNLTQLGRRMGADEVEVYIRHSRNLSVRVRQQEVETVKESDAGGVGFRVITGGGMGFSHSNDFSDKAMQEALERAIAYSRITTPDEHNRLPGSSPFRDMEELFDPEIARVSMDRKIDMAMEVEALAMKDNRITNTSGASFSENETDIVIVNAHGLQKSYTASSCGIGVGVVAEKGEQRHTGSEYCYRRFFADLDPIEKIAGKAAEKAYEMLDPKVVPTQRASVIFDPAVARSIVGGIISAINGNRVLQGASFLKDSMDKQFASEMLTIIDDGTLKRGLGSKPFDGEGVPVSKRTLVDRGVLRGFLYNTITANRAGVESTGNASRGSFTRLPGIGTHNLYVEAGDQHPDDIIANTQRGLLLKGVTGYGINPVNGNFSGGARGFWIENGKISHPVQELTIAGSADDILHDIDMMGNDLELDSSFSAPTFRIREMQIGGA